MRSIFAVAAVCCALVSAACMTPPDKEMQQARHAIDAARAAGADQYAPDEYNAAVSSLKRSEEAVQQRDYRQALNQALDSREHADNAARDAAGQKAAVRSEVERELHDVQIVLDQARTKVKYAEGWSRARRRAVQGPRQTIESADAAVQKARTAVIREDYLGGRDALRGVSEQLRTAIQQIDQAAEPPAAKRRK